MGSQSDAFTLFKSLNNRGIPLSAIDIIKNKLLAEMDRRHHVDVDNSFERWQGIINALPDVADQERFLRHFYNAFKHTQRIRVEGVTRATKAQIIRIYKSLVKRDPKVAFDELTEKAVLYGTFLRPPEDFPVPLARELEELQRIGAASAYQTSPLTGTDPLLLIESDPASAHRFVVSGPSHLMLGLPLKQLFLCSIAGSIPPSRPEFRKTWRQPAFNDGL